MEKTCHTKFAIIGLPGSGKSTFASKLGKLLDIPVHHLDRHMFEPNGKKRDKEEFIEIQKAMLNEDPSTIFLGINWVNYPPRQNVTDFSTIKIKAEKIWWKNIPELTNLR
jgi:adenylate kinase family enzyme